ncbi:MAG: hypothetical protein ACLRFH_00095 [Opitutales bacterium]
MKNKIILILSGLIVANTVLGNVGGEEDVFETKDVFGSNEAQQVYQEATTVNEEVKEETILTNDGLKVQVIPDLNALWGRNGFVIKKGMDQYILEDYIYFRDYIIGHRQENLSGVLEKLRPLYTDKAKKLGKKPIIIKYQIFSSPREMPIKETDEFSIEGFIVWECCDTGVFGAFYNTLSKFGKPIVFKNVNVAYKDAIERNYDLSNCQIDGYYADVNSFDDYLKFAKLDIENLWIRPISIYLQKTSQKELKEQLYLYTRDKRVKNINLSYSWGNDYVDYMIPVPIEYVSCLKNGPCNTAPIINPQNAEDNLFLFKWRPAMNNVTCNTLLCETLKEVGKNVSCKNIVFLRGGMEMLDWLDKINDLETVWVGVSPYELEDKEIRKEIKEIRKQLVSRKISLVLYDDEKLDKLFDGYTEYIDAKDIEYLSGYVNVKNKPDELSDEEWDQVLVLKQKVKEIINITKNEIKLEIK